MTPWLALAILHSCQGGRDRAPDPAVQTVPGPKEEAAAVRIGLADAARILKEGRPDEARQELFRAYREHFEPIEPALRGRDPVGTLALEYEFGRLAAQWARDPVDPEVDAAAICDRIDAAVAALPLDGK